MSSSSSSSSRSGRASTGLAVSPWVSLASVILNVCHGCKIGRPLGLSLVVLFADGCRALWDYHKWYFILSKKKLSWIPSLLFCRSLDDVPSNGRVGSGGGETGVVGSWR